MSRQSVWREGIETPAFPALQGDVRTDVLIIGGGIAGILTAYFLKQKGVSCLLVEKDAICSGTTQNTTAKITFGHGLLYDKLIRSRGTETARMYLEANRKAFDAYSDLCKRVDCDYERKDNYIYSRDNRRALEAEMKALEKIGYRAELRDKLPLLFETAGAVCYPEQAQFHPLKFLFALARELPICEHTPVREMEGCTAVTDKGRIYAKKVVVATHFPFINKHGAYFLKLYQHRSYMLALENAANVDGMYMDEQKTGLTFRNYGPYLLVGGGAHRTGKRSDGWAAVRRFAAANYPRAGEKYFWAAQDCMSLDGMPYIGRYSSGSDELYVASGFCKWGMTGAMVAAELLCDRLTGVRNEYAGAFEPSGRLFTPQLAVNGFEAATNLLTFTRKRCPHLGCALKWNSAEHSWDCPCHGSRFSEEGTVLDNPANGDLKS